jgi:F0F1-type ATP synthase delta subunit
MFSPFHCIVTIPLETKQNHKYKNSLLIDTRQSSQFQKFQNVLTVAVSVERSAILSSVLESLEAK